ncbi:MAG: hypothetical protein ACOZF2_12925 [Thermodesulfobacteriota bacterium]
MPIIELPHGNASFDSDDLKGYIRATGRNYIIQGQQNCSRKNHTKPQSLDCWLKGNCTQYSDTKQAVNEVIYGLINTGEFREGRYICPDTGRWAKGIQIID